VIGGSEEILTVFSSQTWMKRSNATPGTLEVGERGTVVAAAASISGRLGSDVVAVCATATAAAATTTAIEDCILH
jgi:hypothetical protein